MLQQEIKQKAVEFMSSFSKAPSLSELETVIEKNNWMIIYYDINGDDEEGTLSSIQLQDRARGVRAFASTTKSIKIVCILKNLRKEQKRRCLLHEWGHITLGHDLSNLSEEDDMEADQFADECIHFFDQLKRRKLIALISAAIVCLAAAIIIPITANQPAAAPVDGATYEETAASNLKPTDLVYVTPTGERYHLKDCQYVAHNDRATAITLEKAQEDGKTPCKVCFK